MTDFGCLSKEQTNHMIADENVDKTHPKILRLCDSFSFALPVGINAAPLKRTHSSHIKAKDPNHRKYPNNLSGLGRFLARAG